VRDWCVLAGASAEHAQPLSALTNGCALARNEESRQGTQSATIDRGEKRGSSNKRLPYVRPLHHRHNGIRRWTHARRIDRAAQGPNKLATRHIGI
jgi:hypothetical protein